MCGGYNDVADGGWGVNTVVGRENYSSVAVCKI